MKIKTEQDVEQLNSKIKEELGIDIQSYANEEVINSITELLLFPFYFLKSIWLPLVIGFLLFIAGFFLVDLKGFEYVVYVPLGLLLFVLAGIFSGLLYLTYRLRTDLVGIVKYALSILRMGVLDAVKSNQNLSKGNKKKILGQTFKGIIHIIFIPTISNNLVSKVPFVGRFFNGFVKRVLRVVASIIKFDELTPEELAHLEDDDNRNRALTNYANAIDNTSTAAQSVVNTAIRVSTLPVIVSLGISLLLLFLLLSVLN